MALVSVRVKIMYGDVLFVDSEAHLSRRKALKIPGLQVEQNEQKTGILKQNDSRSDQKKSSENEEDEIMDQNEESDDFEMEDENEQEGEIEIQPYNNLQYGDDDQDEEFENELSSISKSVSNIGAFAKYKTKRQKGEVTNFLELPSKRPRKENKMADEATEIIKREEKERKRKQYVKKVLEAEEKATFEKILNETGRKFKQMEEKQLKEQRQKSTKVFRTLGDVPKIIFKQSEDNGNELSLHKTPLFGPQFLRPPQIQTDRPCEICQLTTGKYKTKEGNRFCSVKCFKALKEKEN